MSEIVEGELPKKKVRIGRTTNRTLGFTTPTVSDELCPHFNQRFIRHGVALKENRAICDKHFSDAPCDYQRYVDGIPFCLRYWYGPKYEIVDLIRIPYAQKRDEGGRLLFYEIDGVTETTNYTAHPVSVPIHEAYPLKFTKEGSEAEQETGIIPPSKDEMPLFWLYQNGQEPQKVDYDTGYPVLKYGNMQFYSSQYEDTHEKRFYATGGRLGWHKDV